MLSTVAFAQDTQLQTGVTTNNAPAQQGSPPLVIERPVPSDQTMHKVTPRADTEADMAIRKQADTAIAARAEEVSDKCDASFGARIDWTAISPQEMHMSNPENNCGAILDALEQICATRAGRERVQPSVKAIVCTEGMPPAISMHSGTLVYTLDWQSANPAAFAYAWLAAHL